MTGILVYQWYRFLTTPLMVPSQGLVYEFLPGASVKRLAFELHEQGALTRPYFFILLARWLHQAHDLKAGEYLIMPGTKPRELLNLLSAGLVRQHTITLVEGWTFKQLLQALQAHPSIRSTLPKEHPEEWVVRCLNIPAAHPEGQFLPETYHFPKGTTDIAILKRAHQALHAYLTEAWERRAAGLPYATPYEALIVASLVERETHVPYERSQVAGVIVRRLQKRMPLQIDASVVYGLGEAYNGKLGRADLRKASHYNTYLNPGLPPTPIANPSRASIEAALHPDAGDALYFVATGSGGHYFSKTLTEHNQAVARYRNYQRQSQTNG